MSFVLIIVGLMMLVSAIRGTHQTLAGLVHGDLTGPNNFIYWMLAILAIGAVGYIPKAKPLSNVLLALVIVVLFLRKGGAQAGSAGFFQQFFSQVSKATTGASSPAAAPLTLSGLGQTSLSGAPTLPTLTVA